MADPILVMPRRLAIRILHEAQIAQPEAIVGVVTARGHEPAGFTLGRETPTGQTLWARCWSNPLAPAVPAVEQLAAGGLHLLISLNTKGVLEMRAWELRAGAAHERTLQIAD